MVIYRTSLQVIQNGFVTGLGILMLILGVTTYSHARETDNKYASIVIDADTNRVLHARNADERRYPASLTKVMTLYMVYEALNSGDLLLDEALTVSKHAASQPPSKLYLRPGSKISVSDAISALITKSANDVAVVIAERLGGTESRFAALMTVKARNLGLTHTRFYNASGLPNIRQITTARDMARLAEAILENHNAYYSFFGMKTFTWDKLQFDNHNKLLGKVDGVDGIKTGYIRASGFNLIASAERNSRRIIVVMMGGVSPKSRDKHITDLIEAAYKVIQRETLQQNHSLRTHISHDLVGLPDEPDIIYNDIVGTAEGDADLN